MMMMKASKNSPQNSTYQNPDIMDLTQKEIDLLSAVSLKVLTCLTWDFELLAFIDNGDFAIKMTEDERTVLYEATKKLIQEPL